MPRRIARLATILGSLGIIALALTAATGAAGQEKIGDKKGRDLVATCAKIEGALLQRTKDGQFKFIKSGDSIAPHVLLVGFPKAELVSSCGKVQIDLLLYLGDKLPVREAAITLNDSPDLNADITIDRGIIGLKGVAGKGESVIRVRAGDQSWLITLKDPDSSVVVARFGWQVAGTKHLKTVPDNKLVDDPQMHFGVLVVKGSAVVDMGRTTYTMTAPPGPALLTWDTSKGYNIQRLNELPEDVAKFKALEDKIYKDIAEAVKTVFTGDVGKGLDQMLASDRPEFRRLAVAGMGATDDLPRLVGALENPKLPDVRERAMMVLRNWICREKGQITKLYNYLTKDKMYSPQAARGFVLMLKGFDEDDEREPITYQLLIEAMDNRPLGIREMAHWHLVKMAPAGKSISYDAAATEDVRHTAVEAWRKLIPPGKLPPPMVNK